MEPCHLDADADGHSCGDRIQWVASHGRRRGGATNSAARDQVAEEYPSACGGCGSGSSHSLYAVSRYVIGGAAGFAIFNLEDTETTAVVQVPARLRGKIVSDCASNMDEQSLPLNETYAIQMSAYGFKIISVKKQASEAANGTLESSGRKLATAEVLAKDFGRTAPTLV